MEDFDYYIHLDYSEKLVGYTIIEKEKKNVLLSKIGKLRHYRKVKHKKPYLSATRKRFKREHIKDFLLKWKIREIRLNLDICAEIIEFINGHKGSEIFVFVDDNLYDAFLKLLELIGDMSNLIIVKESKFKKNSLEYKLSLIIDNMLNIERIKSK